MGAWKLQFTKQSKEVSEELHKIECSLNQHKEEITQQLKGDIQSNRDDIQHIVEENKSLKKENTLFKERLNLIEQKQLKNNVIIAGIPEQQWETYTTTKQRV